MAIVVGLVFIVGLAGLVLYGLVLLFSAIIFASMFFSTLFGDAFDSAYRMIAWASGGVGLLFGLMCGSSLAAVIAMAFSVVVLGLLRAVWRRLSTANQSGSARSERAVPPRTVSLPLPD